MRATAAWVTAAMLVGCSEPDALDIPAPGSPATSEAAERAPAATAVANTAMANTEGANAGIANTGMANAEGANAGIANTGMANAEGANAVVANSGMANAEGANAVVANSGMANAEGASAGIANAGMARIPAGIFLMGALREFGNFDEKPAHEAVVAGFWLGRDEITVAAYRACVRAGGCTESAQLPFCNGHVAEREEHPINCIDLRQAAAYCAWSHKRLPSEREWEYAASGGSERRRFAWGKDDPTPQLACFYHPGTCKTGAFPATAFGLRDMTGNVWEWTQSEFRPYPSRAGLDPIVDRKSYVYRGGAWSRRFPKWMRNLLRNRYAPDQKSAAIGVRCAKSVEPLDCPADTEARAGECVRVRGETVCEPGYTFAVERAACVLGGSAVGMTAMTAGASRSAATPSPTASAGAAGTAGIPGAETAITRARTPQHDADCVRHWPKTRYSFLFSGGLNFPARQPVLARHGCVPRDMGMAWTSACCAAE
ncbi:MAG: hypothetical protein EXR75_16445 [Myxococcales bacterium]|nr:hypothetical protein [Myxococcales bacterium]